MRSFAPRFAQTVRGDCADAVRTHDPDDWSDDPRALRRAGGEDPVGEHLESAHAGQVQVQQQQVAALHVSHG